MQSDSMTAYGMSFAGNSRHTALNESKLVYALLYAVPKKFVQFQRGALPPNSMFLAAIILVTV